MGDSPAGSPTLPTTLSLFSDFTSLYLMPSSNGFSIRVIIVMNEFYLPVTNMIQKVFNPIWIAHKLHNILLYSKRYVVIYSALS